MTRPSLTSLLAVAGGLIAAVPGVAVAATAQCRPAAAVCAPKGCAAKPCSPKGCGARGCAPRAGKSHHRHHRRHHGCGAKPCAPKR